MCQFVINFTSTMQHTTAFHVIANGGGLSETLVKISSESTDEQRVMQESQTTGKGGCQGRTLFSHHKAAAACATVLGAL